MSFNYDDYTGTSDYVRFENPGDQVVGTIKEIREGSDFNGNPCPELILEVGDDADEITLTVGWAMLKRLLAEQRPQVGQRIRVTYTGDERTEKGGTMKVFTLDVKDGEPLVNPGVADSEAPF